ncbi:hypothetical protein XHV734_0641 [Xanthomonas hortorum pv. vitians]|nr:hypothetical protein XHV734_0641 [Xanthomonas hortorum pv. vitians]
MRVRCWPMARRAPNWMPMSPSPVRLLRSPDPCSVRTPHVSDVTAPVCLPRETGNRLAGIVTVPLACCALACGHLSCGRVDR